MYVRVSQYINACVFKCVWERERVGVCLFTFTHILSDSWLQDNQGLLSNTKKVFQTHTVTLGVYVHWLLCTINVGLVPW